MSETVDHAPAAHGGVAAWPRRLSWFAPSAAAFLLAVAWRCLDHLPADVAWLLTLGERVLAGARPYVDFVEVNPPASILLYLPAVILAQWTSFRAETIVILLIFVACGASLLVCARLLAAAGLGAGLRRPWLPALAILVLLVLPAHTFAEREHVAVIAILPMLAAYVVRLNGRPAALRWHLAAGIGAGLAIAIKPHFALALLMASALVVLDRRGNLSARLAALVTAEHMTAAAIAAAYGLCVILAFPAFLAEALPLVTSVYLPVKLGALDLAMNLNTLLFLGALLLLRVINRRFMSDAATAILVLAAGGFFLSLLIQGKGWPYHGYPAIALMLLAAGWQGLGLCRPGESNQARLAPMVLLAALGAAGSFWFHNNAEVRGLPEAVARVAPPAPKILAVGDEPTVGLPLARLIGGSWAGSTFGQWITANAAAVRADPMTGAAQRRSAEAFEGLDHDLVVRDIEQARPDIVLVQDRRWQAWIDRDPPLSAAMAGYRRVGEWQGVAIWATPRSASPP